MYKLRTFVLVYVVPRKKQEFKPEELGRFKLVADFVERLNQSVHNFPVHPSWSDPKRRLELSQYLSLFLLGLLNPVVKTMRGLCASSHLPRVQEGIGGGPVSLGSFSEAQAVVDPELLLKIYQGLERDRTQKFGDARLNRYTQQLTLVDSSLWQMLGRVSWALWRTQGQEQKAVRLHIRYKVLEEQVSSGTLTHGNICERKAWKDNWKPGEFYVGDRNYGEDYNLLRLLSIRQCHFAIRLRQDAQWVEDGQPLPLSQADSKAGVISDGWVKLGKQGTGPRVRVVIIQGENEHIIVATNKPETELSADLVALIYRYRWQVELFFRWLKCIFGCRHWMAEGPSGVAIQVYLSLIASQLLLLYSGRRPNKRQLEAIQLYLMGWATLDELMAQLKRTQSKSKKS